MSTSASLVLAAELDIWNRKVNHKLRARADNWNAKIKHQLCELGFFDLMGIKKPETFQLTDGSKELVKYYVGGSDDARLARELRVKIEKMAGKQIRKHELFQGLSEAITNVSNHAYLTGSLYKLWWMTASFNKYDKRLKVVFYDRGITIPKRLPRSTLWERARHYIGLNGLLASDDADMIKAAMEMGRSATGEAHRGKGLQDLLEFIKSYEGGFLSIFSGNGSYTYMHGEKKKAETRRLKYRMPGTLIIWSVDL